MDAKSQDGIEEAYRQVLRSHASLSGALADHRWRDASEAAYYLKSDARELESLIDAALPPEPIPTLKT